MQFRGFPVDTEFVQEKVGLLAERAGKKLKVRHLDLSPLITSFHHSLSLFAFLLVVCLLFRTLRTPLPSAGGRAFSKDIPKCVSRTATKVESDCAKLNPTPLSLSSTSWSKSIRNLDSLISRSLLSWK